jgi:hypothetical protein
MVSTTAAGPTPHFFPPSSESVAVGSDVLVVVHLDRDRHQVGKGIGQILGQIGGLIHGYRIVSPSRLQ